MRNFGKEKFAVDKCQPLDFFPNVSECIGRGTGAKMGQRKERWPAQGAKGAGWLARFKSGFSSTFAWLTASLAAVWAEQEAQAKTAEGLRITEGVRPDAKSALDAEAAATQTGADEQATSEQVAAPEAELALAAEPGQMAAAQEEGAELPAAQDAAEDSASASANGRATSDTSINATSIDANPGGGASAAAGASSGTGTPHASTEAAAGAAGSSAPLALAALLPLAAGGGGGGGGGTAALPPLASAGTVQTTQLDGRAIDGYVKGATVFYDANGNGVRDAGEASAVTGADGSYSLNATLTANGRIVMQAGGIDVLTGQPVGMMVAPSGYTGVNPFTMLLAARPGLSEAALKSALGMAAADSLDDWDPLAGMRSGDADVAAAAQAAFIKSQQVFALVQAAAALAAHNAGANAGLVEVSAVAAAVADAIADAAAGNDWSQTLAAAVDAALAQALPPAPDASQLQLAQALKSALTPLLAAMEDGMAGLAAALQSGDQAEVAASMAAVALSQDLLLDAAQSGNLGLLVSLADADARGRLVELYESTLAAANEGESAPVQLPVMSLAQASDQPPAGAWILADSAANLAAKAIQGHGPAFLASAAAVIVTDTASVQQALVLLPFEHLSFARQGLDASGAPALSWQDYLSLRAAGLYPQGDAQLNLLLDSGTMGSAVGQATQLHDWGIRELDHDGALSLDDAQAHSLATAGLAFVLADEVGVQAEGTTLQSSLSDLQQLAVDEVGAGAGPLHLRAGNANFAASLPKLHPAANVVLHMQAAQLGSAIDQAHALQQAGIDQFDIDGIAPIEIADAQAAALAAQGLTFVDGDVVSLQAGGTQLNNSLHDLQHLGVDAVQSEHGKLVLDHGAALDPLDDLPVFDPGLDVSLRVTPADLSQLLLRPAALAASHIDHLRVSGSGDAATPPAAPAQALDDALAASGADLVLEGAGPLALTDEQAARLLLAGRLQAERSVDLTIVQAAPASPPGDPVPAAQELDLSLAQLAALGADHVAHVQGASLIVEAGVSGPNLEQELQQLLAKLPGSALFEADAQVSLDLGQHDVNAISAGLAAELKLLGIDSLLGEDGAGHAIDRPLA